MDLVITNRKDWLPARLDRRGGYFELGRFEQNQNTQAYARYLFSASLEI